MNGSLVTTRAHRSELYSPWITQQLYICEKLYSDELYDTDTPDLEFNL